MRMVVKQAVMEWHQQVQPILTEAGLCAALQLSFDLHYLEAALVPYTTPAGVRLLHTCRSTLTEAVTHCLCNNDAQCKAVQQGYGDHLSSQSVAAWLDHLGRQALGQALRLCSYTSSCLEDGAAVGLAATSVPQASALAQLASTTSSLSGVSSNMDLPASPRRRLVPNKPVSYIHSRLVGMTSASAAGLASLQGKYGKRSEAVSTPRSPAIKAFHHNHRQQSLLSPTRSVLATAGSQSATAAESSGKPSRATQHLHSRSGGPGAGATSVVGLDMSSQAESLLHKERHGRHKPPRLQPQNSISLNAMTALLRPPPIQIPS